MAERMKELVIRRASVDMPLRRTNSAGPVHKLIDVTSKAEGGSGDQESKTSIR